MIAFFDVDGTLLDPLTHAMHPTSMAALKTLQAQMPIALATGKSLQSVMDAGICDEIAWSYYICLNGQAIYNAQRVCIYQTYMASALVQQILKRAKQAGDALYLEGDVGYFVGNVSEEVTLANAFLGEDFTLAPPYEGQPIYNLIVYGKHQDLLMRYANLEGITLIPAQSSYIDLVVAGCDKLSAIQRVLALAKQTTFAAFGDSLNDYTMFSQASFSVAMGDGHPSLQVIASYVSCPVGDGGVAEGIEQLLLWKQKERER
ncbi:MAG: HAD-IIB family hydrolase [Erysipelotrichaceae bacterium]